MSDRKDPFDLNDPEVKRFFHNVRVGAAREVVCNLKKILKADPKVLHKLIEMRFPCSEQIVDPNCPAVPFMDPDGTLKLGLLGIVNGSMPEGYRVVAHYDDAGVLFDFSLSEPAAPQSTENNPPPEGDC